MANIAVFASGNGSNFEALAEKFKESKKDKIKILVCDKKNAHVLKRAEKFNIKYILVDYKGVLKEDVENYILINLKKYMIDVVFLAGFMRILSEKFIEQSEIPIINIHPSLLPKYRGMNAIEKAIANGDKHIGISIHFVTKEVDSGQIITQKSMVLLNSATKEAVENDIHKLEHKWYPMVAERICELINTGDDVYSNNFQM